MRLPRRVPWASTEELDQICSWIYSENTEESTIRAINRLTAWRVCTVLPHALDSTLGLLVVIHQDDSSNNSHLALRQSYSSALIRMVNGLVDPLQLGAYARPISSIAAQLGLPAWLVELRHAATHEDLPSLELLRQATKESMTWLLHNYFLPTINPASALSKQSDPLSPLSPLLKRYKTLVKTSIRDTSLKTQYRSDILAVLRDIERWVAEARIAASLVTGEIAWDGGTSPELEENNNELDPKYRWALDKLCDALLEKGGLVPLSKKKRVFPTGTFHPPELSIAIWTPLLTHLHANHPDLSAVLCNRIISSLIATSSSVQSTNGQNIPSSDSSYDTCLARWAMWLVDMFSAEDSSPNDLRSEVVTSLFTALGPGAIKLHRSRKDVSGLLDALCANNQGLQEARLLLLQPAGSSVAETSAGSIGSDVAVMAQRLETLLASDHVHSSIEAITPQATPSGPATIAFKAIAPGWRLLDETSGWRPSPIGVYVQVSS